MATLCCEHSELASARARFRGRGERNPHQDRLETSIRQDGCLTGRILPSGKTTVLRPVFSLRRSPWPIALYDSFAQNEGLVTKWIYRKQKAVIKWIQLYPTYNHRYGLMISSLLSSEGQTPRRCAAMATAFLTSSSLSESLPPLSRLLQ